ncbi:MAG: dTMP kinase [Candidatus Diapherotrites archaeon]|nr:dTMP kinase [Candidatus Diapherotrites archaeon]
MRPMFIVFEGLDGSGQSTQATILSARLNEGTKSVVTKEPTNNLIGGLIRAQLTKEWSTTQECLQLLFAADRAHHLERTVEPALAKGFNVVSDRYMFSSIAYGSVSADKEWLKQINSKFRLPDHTFFLDVPPKTCIKRMESSRFELELFEQSDYLEKVRENYLQLSKEYANFHVIDGDRHKEEVHNDIVKVLGND